jgi:hypothetical protein
MVNKSKIEKSIVDSLIEKDYRLHVACGNNNFPEYVNVDLFDFDESDTSRDGSNYDYKLDLTKLDSVPHNFLSEIMFIHGFEHFTRYQTVQILKHWFEKLNEGGIIHLEMPDFQRVRAFSYIPLILLNKNQRRYRTSIIHDMFYGNQWSELDYETHRYLWTKKNLQLILKDIGYEILFIGNSTAFHVPFRDMIVIAKKPGVNNLDPFNRLVNGKRLIINFTRNLVRNFRGLKFIFSFYSHD